MTSDSRPPNADTGTSSTSESENPAIPSPTPKAHAPLTNKDWWPEQIDLSVLHAHTSKSNPLGDRLRLCGRVRQAGRRRVQGRRHRADDRVAGLLAGGLRPLRRPLHPDELARCGHVPDLRRSRRRRAGRTALRPPQQLARQRQPRQGPPTALADQTEVRQQDLVGRPVWCSPAMPRWNRWDSRPSASDSDARTSGNPKRSSGGRRTSGWAPTSATGRA